MAAKGEPTHCSTLNDLKRFAALPGACFTLVADTWANGNPRTNRMIGTARRVLAVRYAGIMLEGGGFIAFGTSARWAFIGHEAIYAEPMPHIDGNGIVMTFRLSLTTPIDRESAA
jgi:hypothetical protein